MRRAINLAVKESPFQMPRKVTLRVAPRPVLYGREAPLIPEEKYVGYAINVAFMFWLGWFMSPIYAIVASFHLLAKNPMIIQKKEVVRSQLEEIAKIKTPKGYSLKFALKISAFPMYAFKWIVIGSQNARVTAPRKPLRSTSPRSHLMSLDPSYTYFSIYDLSNAPEIIRKQFLITFSDEWKSMPLFLGKETVQAYTRVYKNILDYGSHDLFEIFLRDKEKIPDVNKITKGRDSVEKDKAPNKNKYSWLGEQKESYMVLVPLGHQRFLYAQGPYNGFDRRAFESILQSYKSAIDP